MRRRDVLILCLIPFVITGLLAGAERASNSKPDDVTPRTTASFSRRTDKLELATMTRDAYREIANRLRAAGIEFTIRTDSVNDHFIVIVLLKDADAAAAICWDYHGRHPGGLVSMNTFR